MKILTRDDTEHGIEYVALADCRDLEREAEQFRTALKFIAAYGGKEHDTECGTINCNGAWCADQARASLPDEDWIALSNTQGDSQSPDQKS